MIQNLIKNVEKYRKKKRLSSSDFYNFISELYNEIKLNILEKAKEKDFNQTDYNDICEIVLDLYDIIIVSFLTDYAKDCASAPYKISLTRLQHLKKITSRILKRKNINPLIEDLLLMNMFGSYLSVFEKANKRRKEIN